MVVFELNKASDGVAVQANVAGQISPVITIEVLPTKTYTLYANSIFQAFAYAAGPALLPDGTDVELWVEDVSGDRPNRLRIWKLGRFNNVDQYDAEEQIRLDLKESLLLPELHKIVVKVLSAAVIDWTLAVSDFMLQVDRQG